VALPTAGVPADRGSVGRADLPDHLLSSSATPPEHAANLFALKELGNIYTRIMNPTTTCWSSASRRSKAASRRWPSLGPGGLGLCAPEPRQGRRQRRQLDRPLWRHLEPVRQHAEGPGHRGPLRRSVRSGGLPPRHRRPHPRLLRRDAAQPEAARSSRSRRWPISAAARHSADRRQHGGADPVAGRSITARRSSSIPAPSISAATAPRSAA
jgi:hypothetical protein